MRDDTLPVTFEVAGIERVRRGATLAIATVRVDIAGVELILHMAVRREGGGIVVELPSFTFDGRRIACVILPPELSEAIGREVFREWRSSGG